MSPSAALELRDRWEPRGSHRTKSGHEIVCPQSAISVGNPGLVRLSAWSRQARSSQGSSRNARDSSSPFDLLQASLIIIVILTWEYHSNRWERINENKHAGYHYNTAGELQKGPLRLLYVANSVMRLRCGGPLSTWNLHAEACTFHKVDTRYYYYSNSYSYCYSYYYRPLHECPSTDQRSYDLRMLLRFVKSRRGFRGLGLGFKV